MAVKQKKEEGKTSGEVLKELDLPKPPWDEYYPPVKYSETDARTALDRTKIRLLHKSPFFGSFLGKCNIYFSDEIPGGAAACVMITDRIHMMFDKDCFMRVPDNIKEGLMLHETYHLVFKHMWKMSKLPNHTQGNVAADLVVNQIVGKRNLPSFGWFIEDKNLPEKLPMEGYYERIKDMADWKQLENIQGMLQELLDQISRGEMPDFKPGDGSGQGIEIPIPGTGGKSGKGGKPNKATQELAEKVKQAIKEYEKKHGKDSFKKHLMDHHGDWGQEKAEEKGVPDELRDAIVNRAVLDSAQETSQEWGTLPGQVQDYLNALIKPAKIDWRKQIRDSWRQVRHDEPELCKRRISKRFKPAIKGHFIPGIRKQRKAKVLFAIDTSGSMSNQVLREVANELYHCAKKTDSEIYLIMCDTQCYGDPTPFKGQRITKFAGRGGTDLCPPFEFLQKGKYDAMFYATDGYGPVPDTPPSVPVTWVITEGGTEPCKWGKAIFLPNEKEMNLGNDD